MEEFACVILAGGQARRMGGGDKTLLPLAGRRLLSHIITRLSPQVEALALNAHGDPERFSAWNLPVIADPFPGEGPLSGVLAALRWAKAPVLTVPGDTPFLPYDLAERLGADFDPDETDVVMAARGGVLEPVIALWSPGVIAALEQALTTPHERSVEAFARARKWAVATFDNGPDPFFNINTPADLEAAERRLTSR